MKTRKINKDTISIFLGTSIVIGITILSSVALSSSNVFADNDNVVDEINITVPVSCTFSGTGQNSHNAEINNGVYTDNIGTTTMKALCNDNEGFSIYATGFTGNEIGGENSNKLVGTTASGNATIITGTATGPVGTTDTSNWAMKLTPTTTPTPVYPIVIDSDTEGAFTDYHTVPNTYTKVAHRDSGTDIGNEAEGSTFTATYAAYISKTQPADAYSGQVKYTLVHPASEIPLQPQIATSGCINYFPNGGNVEGTMGCQTISSSATSATLLASNFSRAGYGFAGWSDKYDYATNPSAKFYGPNEDITFTAGQYTSPNNGLSLYAVWVKSQGSLQDTTKVAELCGTGTNALTTAPTNGTANLASVSALTDQRDNETYAIAKLADDNCWMIENLRLESEDTVGNNRFDSSVTNQSLAQGYGTSTTYGNFSGLAEPESTGFTSTYSANSLYSNDGSNDTINIGTSNYPAYRMPRYNNLNTPASSADRPQNPTSNTFTNDNTTVGMYSYGNYYTWHAAIADLTHDGTDNSSVTDASLCPTGWHLPTGGNASAAGATTGVNVTGDTSTFREFYNLGYTIMGSNKTAYEDTPNDGYAYYSSNTTDPDGKTGTAALRSFPNNFLYSGVFLASSAHGRGSNGHYWSSTAYNYYGSYYLSLSSSSVRPGTNYYNKYYGQSIRCVAGS